MHPADPAILFAGRLIAAAALLAIAVASSHWQDHKRNRRGGRWR